MADLLDGVSEELASVAQNLFISWTFWEGAFWESLVFELNGGKSLSVTVVNLLLSFLLFLEGDQFIPIGMQVESLKLEIVILNFFSDNVLLAEHIMLAEELM